LTDVTEKSLGSGGRLSSAFRQSAASAISGSTRDELRRYLVAATVRTNTTAS
jgi:hypothetical protein